MKATLSERKTNPQGTNSEGKETRVQINNLEQKEEINSQSLQNEGKRIWKNLGENKKSLGHLLCANIQIIGVPEGEEEEQDIENLFAKIIKETFPNLSKELDMQV